MYILRLALIVFMVGCTTLPKSNTELRASEEIYRLFDTGKKLVMVTHPDCGFSKKAFEDFSPMIKNYLKTNGVIVAPVHPKFVEKQLASVEKWNSASEFKHIPTTEDSIHEVDLGGTPQFYFFKDGKLIETITGWPKDKSNGPLIEKAIKNL